MVAVRSSKITRRPYRLRHAFDQRDLISRSRRRAEVELDDAALLRQLDLLDLLERLHTTLHLGRLRRVRRKTLDEALLLGEHRLLPRVGGLSIRLADRALPLVEIVVARIARDLAAVDLRDLRRDPVHELAVVRREKKRAGQRPQEIFEPDDRLDVQMVGRLVHQQHVGTAQQHARHRNAHLPAARERADVAIDPLVVEAQAMQDLTRLRFQTVAAQMLVLVLHFTKAREDPIHPPGFLRIGHRVLERLELVVKIAEPPATGDRLVQNRPAGHLLDVLTEVSDRQPLRDGHIAFVDRLLANDHPEERCLARTIRSDETDLLTRIELKRRVDEQHLLPVLLADSGERDHSSSSPRPTSTAWPPTFTLDIAPGSPVIAM